MRVLALEPYYGGSHRAVLDGLAAALAPYDWTFDLVTLPARKWKWRMRGSAITMADEVRARAEGRRGTWDLVFASTFINLAEFVSLAGDAVRGIPTIVYFHENQLLYPSRHTAEWDYQFPLTNITSALTADRCLFNSTYNLQGFLAEIPGFLREFPDHQPKGVAERITARSEVLPPPFDPEPFTAAPIRRGERVRIVWPHRWEHDKDPESFFRAIERLAAEALDFEIVLVGQSFRETSEYMLGSASVLGERVVHVGEPKTRQQYAELLASADVAVSTARNEFFGVAMMEACYAGCTPVVPDRLAYPELYPAECRYASEEELVARLRSLIVHRPEPGACKTLAERFTFEALAPRYAAAFAFAARRGADDGAA
jgi:glycosyltransferase involved in cell wall biosynthesis